MSSRIAVGIVIVLIIYYIYCIQYAKLDCSEIFLDEFITSPALKTGDIILFKAFNHFNSVFIGSYFSHIGVVYIANGVPMLFEAANVEEMPLKSHHSRRGIYLTRLADRIKKYKGRCYWKPLNQPLSNSYIAEYQRFIHFALQNMYYDTAVLTDGIKKGLGIEKCGLGTNCGQITFLSLIKLKLLDEKKYNQSIFHHLKWMAEITELDNKGYQYMDLIHIIDHPFHA